MASKSTSPADLSAIPSSVSGDGTTFVKGLKQYLEKYDRNVDKKISDIGEGTVNQVTNLVLTEVHRTNASGNINDIRVNFDTVNVSDYAFAQIWMRKGDNASWIQQGNTSGTQYVIEDVEADTSSLYYVRVVACNNNAGYADFDTAPTQSITIHSAILLCNTPEQFYWSNEDGQWHWSSYLDNGYTDFFELRTDQNAGVWNEHRLDAIPAGTYYSTVYPPTRSGTAYLYVRNVFGRYNTPAVHQYTVTAPQKPSEPILEPTLDGVVISMDGLPSGCTNYIVMVGTEEFEVYTSQWVYYQFSGTITVKYCFVDSVGKGEWSESAECNIEDYIIKKNNLPVIDRDNLAENINNVLLDVPNIQGNINEINADIIQANIDIKNVFDSVDKYLNIDIYQNTVLKLFTNTNTTFAVGEKLLFGTSTVQRIGMLDVKSGEKYEITFNAYFDSRYADYARTSQLIATDDDLTIVGILYTATQNNKIITETVEIPEGATRLYIQNYEIRNYEETTKSWENVVKIKRIGSDNLNRYYNKTETDALVTTTMASVDEKITEANGSVLTTVSKNYYNKTETDTQITTTIASALSEAVYEDVSTNAVSKYIVNTSIVVGSTLELANSSNYYTSNIIISENTQYEVEISTQATTRRYIAFVDDDMNVIGVGNSYKSTTAGTHIKQVVVAPAGATQMYVTAYKKSSDTVDDCIKILRLANFTNYYTKSETAEAISTSLIGYVQTDTLQTNYSTTEQTNQLIKSTVANVVYMPITTKKGFINKTLYDGSVVAISTSTVWYITENPISVKSGECYDVTSSSTTTAGYYGVVFADDNHVVVGTDLNIVSDVTGNVVEGTVVVPQNATYMYVQQKIANANNSCTITVRKIGDLAKFSTTTQTESSIASAVASVNENLTTNYSTTEQTADSITTAIGVLQNELFVDAKTSALENPQKVFGTTTIGSTLTFSDSSYWYYVSYLDVKAGEQYDVTYRIGKSSSRYHVVFTDADNIVKGRTCYVNAADATSNFILTNTVTVSDGATKMYINTLSTSTFTNSHLKVKKLADLSNYSTIKQTENSITTVVNKVSNIEGLVSQNTTSIQQNADDIALVVAQKADGTKTINGDDIVTAINLSSNGVAVEGKYITLTGETNINGIVFDAERCIKANSIKSASIASNAITADKIKAGAITSTKIATGAIVIGGDSDNGKVTINDNGISGNKIQAGTIYGDKIAANTISAEKLKAETITLSGDLKIISYNGQTVFSEDGISFKDNNGYTFANIGRQLIGYNVAHGHHVVFTHAWDRVPYVMCMPRNIKLTAPGWNSSNVSMYCNAYNISNTGFYVRCENIIEAGAKIITSISDLYTNLYDIGMTDDHHHYNAESGKTGTTTYPAVSVSSGSHLTSYTYTKSYTKPANATNAIVQISWKSQPTWNGSVYPRVYLQKADGTTVTTYSGYSATPASGGEYTSDTSGDRYYYTSGAVFGVDNAKLSGSLSSSDTTFKIMVELCYRRYHNNEIAAHLTYFSIDSYEIEADADSQLATGTVDFIACEVNETSYS